MDDGKENGSSVVSVVQTQARDYPGTPPFHPPQAYPELPFADLPLQRDNQVYAMVRTALTQLGFDPARLGTPDWNPLGDLIRPGDFVLIKPNFVTDRSPRAGVETPCDGHEGVIVHGSVLRALADYAFLAAGPTGRIIIADNTMHTTHVSTFQNNLKNTGTQAVIEFLRGRGVPIEAYDLRTEAPRAGSVQRPVPPGDPLGASIINIGSDSEYAGIAASDGFAFNQWDVTTPRRHHGGMHHEYSISNTVLRADAVISVAKLKTHAKVGASLALKNTFGISNQKNWVPHFRRGSVAAGGDERAEPYPWGQALLQWIKTKPLLRSSVRLLRQLGVDCSPEEQTGSWPGNDTIWRGVLDLNKILLYADRQGVMQPHRQRSYLVVIDGIVAGEGDGPLKPTARPLGTILAATDPVAADLVATKIMGFDARKLRLIARALALEKYPLGVRNPEQVRIVGSYAAAVPPLRPPRFWEGEIEA